MWCGSSTGLSREPCCGTEQPDVARAEGTLHSTAAPAQDPFSLQYFLNNALIVFGQGKHASLTFCEPEFSPFFQIQLCAIFVSEWAVTTYVGKRWGWLSQENKPSRVFPQHSHFNCVPFFFCGAKPWMISSNFPFKIIAFLMQLWTVQAKKCFSFQKSQWRSGRYCKWSPGELSITNAHQIQFSSLYCSNLQILKCTKAGETCLQFTI